jgi:hypothetical protein
MSEIFVPNPKGLILVDIAVDDPALVNRSIVTGRRQIVGQPGAERWFVSVEIDTLVNELEERPWRAFVFGLQGVRNWFKYQVACQCHAGAKPVVAAGAGNGYSLPLTGMQPSTRILEAGQWLTVPLPSGHSRLVCLTSDLVTNAAGAATALFNVALNEIPLLGVTVETANPFVPLNSSERRLGLQYSDNLSGANLTLEEAF